MVGERLRTPLAVSIVVASVCAAAVWILCPGGPASENLLAEREAELIQQRMNAAVAADANAVSLMAADATASRTLCVPDKSSLDCDKLPASTELGRGRTGRENAGPVSSWAISSPTRHSKGRLTPTSTRNAWLGGEFGRLTDAMLLAPTAGAVALPPLTGVLPATAAKAGPKATDAAIKHTDNSDAINKDEPLDGLPNGVTEPWDLDEDLFAPGWLVFSYDPFAGPNDVLDFLAAILAAKQPTPPRPHDIEASKSNE